MVLLTMIVIISIATLCIQIYFDVRKRRGILVARLLILFVNSYDDKISNNYTIKESSEILRRCSLLRKLTDNDNNQIINILSYSKHPQKIIIKILLSYNVHLATQALTNAEFLIN